MRASLQNDEQSLKDRKFVLDILTHELMFASGLYGTQHLEAHRIDLDASCVSLRNQKPRARKIKQKGERGRWEKTFAFKSSTHPFCMYGRKM